MSLPQAARPHPSLTHLVALILAMTAVLAACRPAARATAEPIPATPFTRSAEVVVLRVDGQQTYQTEQNTLGDFLAEIGLTPVPGERLLADGRPVTAEDMALHPLPAQLVIDPYQTLTVIDGDKIRTVRTTAATVGGALAEAGMTWGALDHVTPGPDSPTVPEMTVMIERAVPYRIVIEGETVQVAAEATIVGDILAEAGIALGELDHTQPAIDAVVRPGSMIQVVRVTESWETADTPIPYETVYLPDETLPLDTQAFTSPGTPGILRRQTRILSENGVEIAREPAEEWVEQEPVNEVIRYGTQITVQTMDTPDGPIEYWRVVNMRVASYTPSSAGKKPGEKGYGITASGAPAGRGVVAVDPNVVPFRSNVYVPGYGVALAGDTGGGVKGRFVDLGYGDDEYQHWHGTVDVYYLTPVPPADKIRYILP